MARLKRRKGLGELDTTSVIFVAHVISTQPKKKKKKEPDRMARLKRRGMFRRGRYDRSDSRI